MSWYRLSAILFAGWGTLFTFLPDFTNRLAAIGPFTGHANDWTQLVGLFCLSFALLLESAHRSTDSLTRRATALSVITFALPCALLMIYWQLSTDRRWIRWDIANIGLLLLISYGMAAAGGFARRPANANRSPASGPAT